MWDFKTSSFIVPRLLPYVGIALSAVAPLQGAVISARSASLIDVTTAVALAKDGDTVLVPAGSASWSNELDISKAITVKGATTIDVTIGGLPVDKPYPAPPYSAANDKTIITRDNQNGGHSVVITASNGKKIRFSGFTFLKGTSKTLQGCIQVKGVATDSPATTGVRIDNCHFANVTAADVIHTFGCVFGVMDHCLVESANNQLELIWHSAYVEPGAPSGATRINGEGSWADDANWGSYKFWFFEDNIVRSIDLSTNTVKGPGSGAIDCKQGGRYVLRHSRLFDSEGSTSHGTEGSGNGNTSAERGMRAAEVYRNNYYQSVSHNAGGELRSGNIMFHDNHFYGAQPNSGIALVLFREDEAWAGLGGANGSNSWDQNDPILYASGLSATASGCNTCGADVVMTAQGSPGWKPNQWVNYELTNLDQTVARKGLSYNNAKIKSNTANTITTYGVGTVSFQPTLVWAVGNRFEIRKVLSALDQTGRGKGSYITYSAHMSAGNTLGRASIWPNQIREPSFAWNNVIGQSTSSPNLTLHSGYPSIHENQDFFNRAPQAGDPPNSYPYAEYTYPHPLVSGSSSGPAAPEPPTNLQVVPGP
jgi:hypothetical protein